MTLGIDDTPQLRRRDMPRVDSGTSAVLRSIVNKPKSFWMRESELMNKKLVINGGKALHGTVTVLGAKNAINKQLVASLLTDEPCFFENVPKNTETTSVLAMLESLGTEYQWLSETSLRVQTPVVKTSHVSVEYSGYNRMPILFIGALIHRTQKASVPVLGGCRIGPRPVDFHMDGLERMGAIITESDEGISAEAERLHGCDIELPFPSVGATENILFAAVLAKGTTVIRNAAMEPEVIDTILVLQKMGALVYVDAGHRIVIDGVERLHGVRHSVVPDRMEAAAFAAAAVATGGEIEIINARQDHLVTWIYTLRKMGASVVVTDRGIRFSRNGGLRAVDMETDVHPGFMTDWQQPLVVVLTQATGASVIHETMYENRFGFTELLNQMGANIALSRACLGHRKCRYTYKNYLHSAVIIGPTPLSAAAIEIPDLRAGFAYLIAALTAPGESTITGLQHLERGHIDLVARLTALGADVRAEDL